MPLTPQLIDAAVERYWRECDRYQKLAECIGEACQSLLEQHSIRGKVEWRPKNPNRLKAKLEKYLATREHTAEFTDVDSVFRVLKDLAGARITTYFEPDRARVIALVQTRFCGFGSGSQVVAEVKDQPSGFYRATHCMVRLKDEDAVRQYQNLKGLGCEVQVCSHLAQVYHDLEHDLRYKPFTGALSKKENDLLNALARLMEVGDTIINQTRDAVEARQREQREELSQSRAALHPVESFRDNPFLKSLADSPVLLKLAGRIQSSRPQHDLPETPVEFYQEMVRLIAAGALLDGNFNTALPSDANALLAALPRIAWRLFDHDARASRYSRSTLIDTIVRATSCSEAEAAKLLAKTVEHGLFAASAPANGEHFQFAHPTFRDFLAAKHVVEEVDRVGWGEATVETCRAESRRGAVNVGQMLDAQAFEPDWQSLIVFLAGLMNEPLDLLHLLADRKRDDLYRHRLGLACRCYRALSASRQSKVAPSIESVFEEVLSIAKRCEHDDAGHRKPWLEWAELLLPSEAGADRLCAGLLTLDGRYHGWTVSGKVLEMFERVLTRGKVSASVVDAIAEVGVSDENQWGVNTARLALRLAEDEHRQKLVGRFMRILENPETSDRVRVRVAEAVATAEASTASLRAGEMLVALAQGDSLTFEHSEKAVNGLVSLLGTSLAPIAAPLLVNHLLDPSSRHHFWLAWRIIGKAEREPDNPWSAVFLAITLIADREDDRRLKLWSGQVLAKHSQPHLRDLGLRSLLELAHEKKSHSWAHAARWLVENGPAEPAEKARAALLAEASSPESDQRMVATSELLEMGAIAPDGGPIRDTLRDVVLREIKEHGEKYGQKYGPLLHVTAPGAPKGNVDLELFADNPAEVIKRLHTFNGPSFYLRDRDDPNEEKKRMRHWNAKLLLGTRYWPEVLRSSIQAVNQGADPDRDGALGIVLFSASGSALLELLRKSIKSGSSAARTRHYLLEELYERGWRLRFRGRRVEVLRKGREEPRTESETEL